MNFLDKYFNELIDDDLPDREKEGATQNKISKPEPSFSMNRPEIDNDVSKSAILSTPNTKSSSLFFSPSNDVNFGPMIPSIDNNSYITSTPTANYDDFYVNFNISMENADPVSTDISLLPEPCVPSPRPYSPLVVSSSSSTVSAPSPRPLSPGDDGILNPIPEDDSKKFDVTIDGKTVKMDAETLLGEFDVITASPTPIFTADGLMNIVPIDEAKTEDNFLLDRLSAEVSGSQRHLDFQSLPLNNNNRLNVKPQLSSSSKPSYHVTKRSDDPIDFEFDSQLSPSLPAPAPYQQPVTYHHTFTSESQSLTNQPHLCIASAPTNQPSVSALSQQYSNGVTGTDSLSSDVFQGTASAATVGQPHGISLGTNVYPAHSNKPWHNIALTSTKQTVKRIYVNYPADSQPDLTIPSSKCSTQSFPSYSSTSGLPVDSTLSPPRIERPFAELDRNDDLFPPRPIPSYMKEPLPSPQKFKTDITKFFSRHPCDIASGSSQTGQNVIPLSSERRPEERMWYVDGQVGRFRNVPIVKQVKRPRGRPKGRTQKVKMRETMSKILTRNNGRVCARCVELYQKITLNSMLKNDEKHLICEDCGNFISKEPVNSRQALNCETRQPAHASSYNVPGVVRNLGHHSQIFVQTGLENLAQSPLQDDEEVEDVDEPLSEPSNDEIKAGTKIEVDGCTIINITKPRRKKVEIMHCWNCHGTSSMGIWHRHKTTPNKFLCDFCLNFFKRRNSVVKPQSQ